MICAQRVRRSQDTTIARIAQVRAKQNFGSDLFSKLGSTPTSTSSKPTRICTAPFGWGQGAVIPSEGVKFGCVCSYRPGHEDAWIMTGPKGTTTHPNLYPLAGDDGPLTPLKRGCANSGGFGAR